MFYIDVVHERVLSLANRKYCMPCHVHVDFKAVKDKYYPLGASGMTVNEVIPVGDG